MDDFKDESVKDRLSKEYVRRVKKVIRSKRRERVINSWAVSLLRYSGGVVRWTKVELMNLDRKTRKLLIIQDALHARANGSRLYLMRSVVKKEDEG